MNTIEETVRLAGLGRKKAMQGQIDLMKKTLMKGEELLGVACSYPKPVEQLYVTDKRIIVHKIEGIMKNKKTEIPLSSISSINTSTKGLSANIEIVASNNSASVEKMYLHIAEEIKRIVDSLINQDSPKIEQVHQIDVAEQLKKFADLRDAGILTEEEFQQQKMKLLNS